MTKEVRIYNGEKTASSTKGVGKTEQLLIPYTKINTKQVKELNVRPETMKLRVENKYRQYTF